MTTASLPKWDSPPAIAWHNEKQTWSTIDRQMLIDALNDQRIPEDAEITQTQSYPGLAILLPNDGGYIGYIDLFDGEVVINPKARMQDGKNPLSVDASGHAPAIYSEMWVGAK